MSVLEAFPTLDEDDVEPATAVDKDDRLAATLGIALQHPHARAAQPLAHPQKAPRSYRGRLSRDGAYRTLRDALALQLARRGFDGLRQQPLQLLTELAANFIKSLGARLAEARRFYGRRLLRSKWVQQARASVAARTSRGSRLASGSASPAPARV